MPGSTLFENVMSIDATDGSGTNAPHVTTYDVDVPLSTSLVYAVAAFKGRDPAALCGPDEPRLADVVEPDFVDTLPRSGTDSWRFEFDLWNCRVVVTGKGTITVTGA